MHNLRIDARRLWDSLMDTARIGGTPKGGIRRLTLSDLDREVRDWFRDACTAAGCTVTVDDMGNMFARRPGRDNTRPPIAIGSHLDTQPTGGKFDGVLGVLAGLEVMRTLQDAGFETEAPVELINWTNEEGARFAPAMLGSGVFAGVFSRAFAGSREDREGASVGDELERIGYRGAEACGVDHRLGAFFELHIEQGPVLEDEGRTIGVVTGVQGIRWFDVTVTGFESHAGTTPMHLRRDALVGAARMIKAIRGVALAHAPQAVATVGMVEVQPGSRNILPGQVFFTIDLRHPDDSVLDRMEQEVLRAIDGVARESGLEQMVDRVLDSPSVRFDPGCVETVRSAAGALGLSWRDIVSGAGHDAVHVARVAPTAMIFIPCEKGISHNETESASFEHVAAGADVLLRAVLEYDRERRAG